MRKLAMVIVIGMAALMLLGFARSVQAPAQPAGAPAAAEESAANPIFGSLFIFILAGFVGFEVIGRVSPSTSVTIW